MGSLSSVVAPIANIGVKTIASAGQYFLSNSERLRDLDALNAKNAQLKQSAALQKQSNLLALQKRRQIGCPNYVMPYLPNAPILGGKE
jgi:hypothetical protein